MIRSVATCWKFCLIYTNNSVVLTVFFFQHAHNSSNKSFIFWHFYYLGFQHWKIVTLCSSESDEISRPFFIFFVHCVDFIKPSSSHWLRSRLPLNHELCSRSLAVTKVTSFSYSLAAASHLSISFKVFQWYASRCLSLILLCRQKEGEGLVCRRKILVLQLQS